MSATIHVALRLSVLLAFAYLGVVAVAVVVAALRAGGRSDDSAESHEALSTSRLTSPVSVIVPLTTGTQSVSKTISLLLGLRYPNFEVIVVNSAPGPSIETLVRDWELEAKEFFYRRTLEASEPRRIYRSLRDSRLLVVDKASGGYGDSLNCGVNLSRYPFILTVRPEVSFDREALLRAMSAALRDPAHVVGSSSHLEQGVTVGGSAPFERLASARSLMDSRLVWSRLRSGLGPAAAAIVWQRDAVLKVNGFSQTAADADLEMMFRLQRANSAARFARGTDIFAQTGPQGISRVLRATARRQTAALQLLAGALRNPPRGIEPKALASFLSVELLTPFAQAWIATASAVGAFAGWFSWNEAALALVSLSFGNAAVSAAAILLRGAAPDPPAERELWRLLLAAPVEFLIYRPALAMARMVALFASTD